jgi:hypothetical protein
VRRGLGRAQRKKYQVLYRQEYVRSHGGGKVGKEALRARNRQQKRSSRSVRYLPLLFETADHRFRLWTWEGPSKLFLKSVHEVDGMRELFVPAMRPRVISHHTDVNHHLRAVCKAAAAGIPFQALSHQERRAYAFLLWNECRRYEYLMALDCGEDPRAEDAAFRLVSQLLVEALTRPLEFVEFLVIRIRPGIDELVQDIQASECPLERSDPLDQVILHFHATLTAAHAYLAASGLSTSPLDRSTDHRRWFRRQVRLTERTDPALRSEPDASPFPILAEDPVLLDAADEPGHAGDGQFARSPKSAMRQSNRRGGVKGCRENTSPRRTVKK